MGEFESLMKPWSCHDVVVTHHLRPRVEWNKITLEKYEEAYSGDKLRSNP